MKYVNDVSVKGRYENNMTSVILDFQINNGLFCFDYEGKQKMLQVREKETK